MTVDHGLGGKDSVKSKEKRAKRAARQKIIARNALTGGKKKSVVFNEESRIEYLTGFRKRKEERRKYGLNLKIQKDQKKNRLKRLQTKKNSEPPSIESVPSNDKYNGDNFSDDENEKDGSIQLPSISSQKIFDDDHTKSVFGGSVSIFINEIEIK